MNLLELLIQNNNYEPIEGPGSGGLGTDKEIRHNYVSEYYEDAFAKYRFNKINLLEIGIACGASLKLWDSFFTNSKIYGVDINSSQVNPYVMNDKFELFFENAYDQIFVNKIPNMDIIIDDGPHTLQSQLDFIDLYLPKVNAGGLLIIEDIASIDYVNHLKQRIGDRKYTLIDTREKYGIHDNILFSVEC